MSNLVETTNNAVNKIEEQCGINNGAFLFLIALFFIDTKEWKCDRSMLAKFYQIIDIIEKDEDLKNEFHQNQAFNATNNLQSQSPQKGNAGEGDRDATITREQN